MSAYKSFLPHVYALVLYIPQLSYLFSGVPLACLCIVCVLCVSMCVYTSAGSSISSSVQLSSASFSTVVPGVVRYHRIFWRAASRSRSSIRPWPQEGVASLVAAQQEPCCQRFQPWRDSASPPRFSRRRARPAASCGGTIARARVRFPSFARADGRSPG